jgi:hypothetical protein
MLRGTLDGLDAPGQRAGPVAMLDTSNIFFFF